MAQGGPYTQNQAWSQGINATPRLDPVGSWAEVLNGSDLGRGEAADRRAVGRGCAGVAVASGDQSVAVCHPAGGDRVAAAGQARAEALAAAVVAGGAGRDLPGLGGGQVVARDRQRAGPGSLDSVPGGGGQRRGGPVPGVCRGPAGPSPGAPSQAG